jgi:hypothetical protein
MNRSLFLCLAVVAMASLHAQEPVLLRSDANQLKQKMASISQRHSASVYRSARTTVSEREVNAYLRFEAAGDFPAGVVDPRVSILGTERVSGRAVVDLDRVRLQKNPTSLLDPVQYLRGRLPVTMTGLVIAKDGVGRFAFEEADVAGVPIPKLLIQQIVSFYSRSPGRPSGFGLDDPVALPAGIQEILVERGQAIVVQ